MYSMHRCWEQHFFFSSNGLLQGPLTHARITATNVTQRKYLIFQKNIMHCAWTGVCFDLRGQSCLPHDVCETAWAQSTLHRRLPSKQGTRCSLMLIMAFIININQTAFSNTFGPFPSQLRKTTFGRCSERHFKAGVPQSPNKTVLQALEKQPF